MILHNVRYFTSIAMSLKEQKKLLSETVNAIFRFGTFNVCNFLTAII